MPLRRPTSITVIAWYLIVTSAIVIPGSLVSVATAEGRQMMAVNPLPIPVQVAMLYAGLLMAIVAGIAMLKGKNWSRFLYVGWSGVGLVIGALTNPPVLMVPAIPPLCAVAWFLFRPQASRYFTSAGSALDPEPLDPTPSENQIPGPTLIGILLNIFAGFMFMGAGLMAFFNANTAPGGGVGAKSCMIFFFLIPAVLVLGFGLAASGFRNWKRDAGVVLLASSGIAAYCVLTVACAYLAQESRKTWPSMPPNAFTDYIVGGAFALAVMLVGFLMIKANAQAAPKQASN